MGGSTMTRKAVVRLLAAVALGVGVFLSSSAMAANSGRCDPNTACNDEISHACRPNPSQSCVKNLIDQCKARQCTCTGEAGLPRCPVAATTTTTSSTTSTTAATTSTTSTSTSTTTSSTTKHHPSTSTSTTTSSTTTTS